MRFDVTGKIICILSVIYVKALSRIFLVMNS